MEYDFEMVTSGDECIIRVTEGFAQYPDWEYDFWIPESENQKLVFEEYRRLDEQSEDEMVHELQVSPDEIFPHVRFKYVCQKLLLRQGGGEIVDEDGEKIAAVEYYGVNDE